MVKCEFCDRDVHSLRELEDHLRESHGFNEQELEEYGFDRGLYYEARLAAEKVKKEAEG